MQRTLPDEDEQRPLQVDQETYNRIYGGPTQLYRHFAADGTLLYVGISLSTVSRLAQHEHASHWFSQIARVEVERFPTRTAAMEAERLAVLNENPLYNKALRKPPEYDAPSMPRFELVQLSKEEVVERVVRFKPVYTDEEAAAALRVSKRVVRQLIADRKLGFILVPNATNTNTQVRITGWHLIAYLENPGKCLDD
jgi:hypothetical protein